MTGPTLCSRCGTPLVDAAAGPVCPACLLKLGLATPTGGETVMASPPDASATVLASRPTGSGESATVLGSPTPVVASGRGGATPKHIGPYHLVSTLGEGGMGVVYLAEQTEPIRRTVALKLIKLGMDTHEVVARFEAERQALALMDHPNIASVLDAGATPDGRPYFVMEYAPGAPITDYCDAHQLTTRQRVELFRDVCAAVQHAHQKGIIHRDLKPSNVLVIDQDGNAVPKVIDFGIAKATEQRLTEKTMFTQHGALIGTPEYMSPEQAEPGAADIDTRTDIYAMGVILYEMLVGALPFSPTRLRQAAYSELLRIIREEEPARPSTRLSGIEAAGTEAPAQRRTTLPGLSAQLRGDLDWITLKALEKERTRRYASASEFSADLSRYLNNEPIVARPAALGYRVQKFVRRNRLAVTAASLVFLAVVAGLVVSSVLYVQEGRARREAVAQQAEANRQRTTAELNAKRADDQRLKAESATAAEAEARVREADQRSVAVQALAKAETEVYFNHIDLAEREWAAHSLGRAVELLADTPAGLRGWEWDYLWRLSHPGTSTVDVGIGGVRALGFSADGQQVLSASVDMVLTARHSQTSAVLRTVKLPGGAELLQGAFSADGRSLAGQFRLDASRRTFGFAVWDVATGRPRVASLPIEVGQLALSADGTRVATSTTADAVNYKLQMWSAVTGAAVVDLGAAPGRVSSIAFSPDGSRLAITGRSFLNVLDASTGRAVATITTNDTRSSMGRWVQFSADGGTIFEGNPYYGVRAWSATDGKPVWTYAPGPGVNGVAVSRTGSVIAALDDRTLRVVDSRSGQEQQLFAGHEIPAGVLAISPDGGRLVSGGMEKVVRQWALRAPPPVIALDAGKTSRILAAAVSPNGDRAWALMNVAIRSWDLQTAADLLTLPPAGRVQSPLPSTVVFSGDGTRVIFPKARFVEVGSGRVALDQVLALADGTTGRELATFQRRAVSGPEIASIPPTAQRQIVTVGGIDFSTNGKRVAMVSAISLANPPSGSSNQTPAAPASELEVWDATTGRSLFRVVGTLLQGGPSLSPDGRVVAAVAVDAKGYTTLLYDATTGRPISRLVGAMGPVVFSQDSAVVATGFGFLQRGLWECGLWDARSGARIGVLPAHGSPIGAMAFSPDRARLVTVTADQSVRVFDTATSRQTLAPRSTNLAAESREVLITGAPSGFGRTLVQFSPDGRAIIRTRIESVATGLRIQITTWDGSRPASLNVAPPRRPGGLHE